MSIVRLAVMGASSGSVLGGTTGIGGFYAGGGYPTPATAGDLIGVVPLNVAPMGFGASATASTQFGYGNTLGQYGYDRLSFAFSQGDYTASGATPQTFLQNQSNSASSFSQYFPMNQPMFNTTSLQNDVFLTNVQSTDLYNGGYLSVGSYPGAGFGTGTGAFALLSSLSPSLVSLNTTAALNPGLINDGLSATPTPNPTETSVGLGVPGIDGNGAVNAAGATTVQALGSDAANALGAAHSTTGLGMGGGDTASPLHNGETALSGGVAAGEIALGNSGQAVQAQGPVAHLVTTGTALLSQDHFNIKAFSADPFAHYTDLTHVPQADRGAPGLDVDTLTGLKLAAAIGSDHLIFSDHVVSPVPAHAGQTGDVHSDPVGHALHHIADAGGHLL